MLECKMDWSYIYFKKINIDQDKSFTADFSQENEQEEVLFNKENEYGVTGLTINSILPDEKIIKIENVKEQKSISDEIQELIKNYKEPDLTFFKKIFNTSSIKNQNFLIYDYVGHLEKFGFEWNHNALGFNI